MASRHSWLGRVAVLAAALPLVPAGNAAQASEAALPDLQVTLRAPATASVGSWIEIDVEAHNRGAAPAPAATLTVAVPSSRDTLVVARGPVTCDASAPAVCELGTVAPGTVVAAQLRARLLTTGSIVLTARAASQVDDASAADNVAMQRLTVRPRGAIGCYVVTPRPDRLRAGRRGRVTVRVTGPDPGGRHVRLEAPGVRVSVRADSTGVARATVRPLRVAPIKVWVSDAPTCRPSVITVLRRAR